MVETDLTVIIITRNRVDSLPVVLQHVEVQEYPTARFEVLVADNGSTDGTTEILDRYAEGAPVRVRCLHLPERVASTRARNLAAQAAQGRWLLYLDEDLLASPRLVARHVQMHESSPRPVVLMGALAVHPQMDRLTMTKWFLPEFREGPAPGGMPGFMDWRAHNLSLSRQLLLDNGGFDEDFVFPHFSTAELGARISQTGVSAVMLDDAPAYIWRPISFQAARDRHYAMGYSLFVLVQKTGDRSILNRIPVVRTPLRRGYERMIMPQLVRLCKRMEPDSPTALFYMRRILRYDLHRGFTEAAQGVPPALAAD